MKTIKAIFINEKTSDKHILENTRAYTFNTDNDNVEIGDMIDSGPRYDNKMLQVTGIFDEVMNFYRFEKDGISFSKNEEPKSVPLAELPKSKTEAKGALEQLDSKLTTANNDWLRDEE